MFSKILLKILTRVKNIPTGTTATITLTTLIAIYSLSVVQSLPGLAIAPILGQLEDVFRTASQFEIQMLESLPSLVIIPFILIAGKLSERFSKKRLVVVGLSIFVTSSVLYMIPLGIDFMLFNSVLLGIGAGIVIPLAAGLVADYFAGEERTRQLGIISGIANLSLVVATAAAGYLAGIYWQLAFLVYFLSAISLYFSFRLKKDDDPQIQATSTTQPVVAKHQYMGFNTDWPVPLMGIYLFLTLVVVVVPFNLSILMDHYKIGDVQLGGTIMSVFFLAITMPGFFLSKIISRLGRDTDFYALALLTAGGLVFLFSHSLWAMWVGSILLGLGYGIYQPLIYDRTASWVTPARTTFALSLVLSMNYVAIIAYPFFQKLIEAIFNTHSPILPFWTSAVMMVGYLGFVVYRRRVAKK